MILFWLTSVIHLASTVQAALHPQAKIVLDKINELRKEQNVPVLCLSEKLVRSAETHSKYQAREEQMTHDGLLSIGQRILAEGFSLKDGIAGENVGKQESEQPNGLGMFDAWKQSPSHLANMIKPDYNFVGIAIASGDVLNEKGSKSPSQYWTVHFGSGTDTEVCTDSSINPTWSKQQQEQQEAARAKQNQHQALTANLQNNRKPASALEGLLRESSEERAERERQKEELDRLKEEEAPKTLTEKAKEFIPPTVTVIELKTVAKVSVMMVPTTIISMVTVSVPCPSADPVSDFKKCPPPPPCICAPGNAPIASTASGGILIDSLPTGTSTSSNMMGIQPTMIPPIDSQQKPATGTATVLVISDHRDTMTTTIPPNTIIPAITGVSVGVKTVFDCGGSTQLQPVTPQPVPPIPVQPQQQIQPLLNNQQQQPQPAVVTVYDYCTNKPIFP